jgi:hypothetical protein
MSLKLSPVSRPPFVHIDEDSNMQEAVIKGPILNECAF